MTVEFSDIAGLCKQIEFPVSHCQAGILRHCYTDGKSTWPADWYHCDTALPKPDRRRIQNPILLYIPAKVVNRWILPG